MRLRAGTPVSLVGEAGIGKTTVWRACVEQWDAEWSWVAGCSEPERDVALAVLADLFAAVPAQVVARLPAPQRRAVDVVLLRADPAGADDLDARQLGVTVGSLLELLAERGTVLLAVDDLHWCDQASLDAFRFALRRVPCDAISILTTRRRDTTVAVPNEVAMGVGPLSADATAALIHHSGAKLRPRALARVIEVSQGNPLYAVELARAVPAETDEIRVPPSLRALLSRSFDDLPEQCRTALLDVAVRGALPDTLVLAPAHQRGILTAEGSTVRFSHPLLAEAVRNQATPAQLRAAHQRAAAATADPVAAARYRALAATEPDEDVARALDTAVNLAQQRGDVAGARELAELALRLTPAAARPIHRVAALARSESTLAHDQAAHRLAEELLHRATDPQDRFLALTILTRTSPVAEAIDHAAAVARITGLSEGVRLQAIGEQAWVLFSCGGLAAARTLLATALSDTSPDTPGWGGLTAIMAIFDRKAGRPHDESALQRAIEQDRAGLVKPAGRAIEAAAGIAAYEDRHDEARRLFEEAAALSATRGDGQIAIDVQLAHLGLRFGRLREARAAAERIHDGAAHDRRQRDVATLAQICAWQGDFEAARRALAMGPPADALAARPGVRIAAEQAAGLIALLTGDAETAWSLLSSAAEALEAGGSREPSSPGVLPLAIEAASAIGELDQAEVLCARLDTQAGALNSRWGRAAALSSRGHIAAARGDLRAAAAHFGDAAGGFRDLDLPREEGRVLLAGGSALRRIGQRAEARERLLAAVPLFERAGAEGLARKVEAELARLGQQPGAGDALTQAQQQVARLAAAGLRNTEIGLRLQISPKTVERHLGQVYRKLGLRGRAELATALRARGVAATR